jgi:hypothetical protein
MARRQRDKLFATSIEERIGGHRKRLDTLSGFIMWPLRLYF